MPVGFLTGSLDPVAAMMPGAAEAMAGSCPTSAAAPRGGGRPLGAAGEAGGDQRRPAAFLADVG
jgi:hypothetical protein